MRVRDIGFEEEELVDFQRVFPSSKAAALLDRVVGRQIEGLLWTVSSVGSSDRDVRAAQGGLQALRETVERVRELAKADILALKEREKAETEEKLGDLGEESEGEPVDMGF